MSEIFHGPFVRCEHDPLTVYLGDDPGDGYQPIVANFDCELSADDAARCLQMFLALPALFDACEACAAHATPEWCDCAEAAERGKCRHMAAAAALSQAKGQPWPTCRSC